MIKITNNTETKVVTQGAYENFYKPLGFTIVNSEKSTKKEKVEKEVIQENEVVPKKSLKGTKESFKRK